MPTFDTVIEPDLVELRNAVEQANKEIGTRFDFKGSDARVELADKGKERTLTLFADSDFQLGQVRDVVLAKLSKRGVDVRFLDLSAKPEKLGGDKLKTATPLKNLRARKVTCDVPCEMEAGERRPRMLYDRRGCDFKVKYYESKILRV